jgi:hypothetical protein
MWTRSFGQRRNVKDRRGPEAEYGRTPAQVRAPNRRVNRLPGATAPNSFNTHVCHPTILPPLLLAISSKSPSLPHRSLYIALWLIDTPFRSLLSHQGKHSAPPAITLDLFADLEQWKAGSNRFVPRGTPDNEKHGLTSRRVCPERCQPRCHLTGHQGYVGLRRYLNDIC